jgi:flagellar motor switch protein FliN/FliY
MNGRDGAAAPAENAGGRLIRHVGLRVWAELGRARLPVGRAVGLAPGAVVELDRGVDEPLDLYVNGRRLALGRLILTDDGEWAVRIESVSPDVHGEIS